MPCATPPAIWPSTTAGLMKLTAVLDHEVARDLHPTGGEVDLDPAHVRRLRPPALAAVPLGDDTQRLPPGTPRPRAPALAAISASDTDTEGTPGDVHRAVVDLEVLAARPRAGRQRGRGCGSRSSRGADRDCAARHRCRPAPAGARDAERRDRSVAVAHPHLLDRDADLVGGDLRQRRLVALAVRHLLGDAPTTVPSSSSTSAGGLATERRRPPPPITYAPKSGGPGRRLDEGREPEPEVSCPPPVPPPARSGQRVELGVVERLLEGARVPTCARRASDR